MLEKALLLLECSNPYVTKNFYQNIGFSLNSVSLYNQTYSWLFSKNIYFVIPDSEHTEKNVKLFFIGKNNNLLLKISGASYYAEPETSDHFQINSLLNEIHSHSLFDPNLDLPDIIPIIRTPSIDHLMLNYERFGKWKKEKHETGPTHYCLDNESLTIELYPERKKSLGIIELVAQNTTPDLDVTSEFLLKDTEKLLSFADPEGLSVNIIKQEVPRHVFRK